MIARRALALIAALALAACGAETDPRQPEAQSTNARPIAIVIHGGAGALAPGRYTPEEEAAHILALEEARDAGYAVLDAGGSSIDAVIAAIMRLEDDPKFNAGKGAVFTSEGTNELDASIMDGATRNAGAVAGVKRVKNPILLARAVMDKSVHVMMAREGAETFAEEQGLELVDPQYFYTERRWESLQRAIERAERGASLPAEFKFGTVGAVALDRDGNLAAGTSTGGMTYKRWGRVGDSPIIGAGTYADNNSCGVSATGWGEYFIRLTIARDICAQVEYGGKTVTDAADDVIFNRLSATEGTGGVIVLGANGEIATPFNTDGMFRAWRKEGAEPYVAIYGE